LRPRAVRQVLIVVAMAEDQESSLWMKLFADALPAATIVRREPDQPVDAASARADYVVVADPCATVFLEQAAPRAIFTVSAGVGHVAGLPGMPRAVPLIRVEDGGMAPQMVRYVLAAALRVALGLDRYVRQQREAAWVRHLPREVATMRAGVLGLGVIGGAIARALAAQGFAVRGYARRRVRIDGIDCFDETAGLPAFLAGLDFLVSVVPATPATEGLLNAASLAYLADGAHLVNIGRGSALVEADLLALLDGGKLAGATLDVFSDEPLPADHPFWRRPDVVVTPHVAGMTLPAATVAQIAGKIARLERGEAVTGVVDHARGY
jgi:glyoxylate/hydroxypyruvate reductase A